MLITDQLERLVVSRQNKHVRKQNKSSETVLSTHVIDPGLVGGGGTQDKKMSKGHLPRVVYHQEYNVY